MFHQEILWGISTQAVLHESDQDPQLQPLLPSLDGSFSTDLRLKPDLSL